MQNDKFVISELDMAHGLLVSVPRVREFFGKIKPAPKAVLRQGKFWFNEFESARIWPLMERMRLLFRTNSEEYEKCSLNKPYDMYHPLAALDKKKLGDLVSLQTIAEKLDIPLDELEFDWLSNIRKQFPAIFLNGSWMFYVLDAREIISRLQALKKNTSQIMAVLDAECFY